VINSIPSLWQMARGNRCVVTGFDNSIKENIRTRLEELGFRKGAVITCSMAPKLGAPKLYKVANSVYSLEKNLAQLVHTEILSA